MYFSKKVIERSQESHCKLALFLAAKLSKVHEKITKSCQYLFLVANYWKFMTKSPQVVSIYFSQVTVSYSKFTRTSESPERHHNLVVLFNTQIIPHYKNTFSVWSAINQYKSIFRTNNYTRKSSLLVPENVGLQ